MKKLNIVFDGNFLMHKTKSIFMSYNKFPDMTTAFKTPENRAGFLRKILMDFSFSINQILSNTEDVELKRVVVVFDKGQNWRKDIYPEYKAKKIPDDGSDDEGKTNFYGVMSKVKSLLDKRGFITSDVERLEGDDLCVLWSREFSKDDELCVIITADRDIVQAVDDNISVFNNNSQTLKLYTSKNVKKTPILSKKMGLEIIKTDSEEYLFKKTLFGDSGDNIPNVMKGMGEKKVDSVTALVEDLGLLNCDSDEEGYIQRLAIICNSQFGNKKDEDELAKNIKRNRDLIHINEEKIPKELLCKAKKQILELKHSFNYKGEINLSNILKQE